MLKGIEAIIFDIDGTLMDSMRVWTDIDDIFLEKYGLEEPEGFHEGMEGKSYSETAQYFLDLFPVGRLDKDTEGLLLITNDGELAHRLLSPKKHVDKVYFAKVKGVVTEEDQRIFAEGVSIGQGEMAKPSKLEILVSDEISEIRLTIQEGKFHQVKRMFLSVGKEVIYLKRLSMGTLQLDENLALGEYRPLTEEELKQLC